MPGQSVALVGIKVNNVVVLLIRVPVIFFHTVILSVEISVLNGVLYLINGFSRDRRAWLVCAAYRVTDISMATATAII